jgi:hypothetical protein
MATRIKPLTADEVADPALREVIQFSKQGFGDAQLWGVIARSPELVKRITAVFQYLFGGTARVEPGVGGGDRPLRSRAPPCYRPDFSWCAFVVLAGELDVWWAGAIQQGRRRGRQGARPGGHRRTEYSDG